MTTKQQQIIQNQPSSFNRFSPQRNSNTRFGFNKPPQTTTTALITSTTTRRPTTTAIKKVSTKRPFTFSPRVFPNNNGNNRGTTNAIKINQQQITDNRISPLASGTVQVSQTQKNRFTSTDVNRFSVKPANNQNHNSNNKRVSGGTTTSSAVGPRAETQILRINDSPAYTLGDTNSIVLFCDFDYAKCPVRSNGQSWDYTTYQTPGFGKGFATVVDSGKQSNLEIRSVMNPSGDGTVCLYFRFVNFAFGSDGGRAKSSGPLKFTVTVTSVKQSRKSVEITDRSNTALDWLTAKVQFTDLHSMFLLIFEIPRNTSPDNVYLAIDDILVTKGKCHM